MGPNGENLFPKEKGGKAQIPLADYEEFAQAGHPDEEIGQEIGLA